MSFWHSSFVKRWHNHPELSNTNDVISGHQQRVSMILLRLKPDVSKNTLVKALVHDLGEADTGDMPWPFKQRNPEIASLLSIKEDEYIKLLGFDIKKLDKTESGVLKLSDKMDAVFWEVQHNMYVSEDVMYALEDEAINLGVHKNYTRIIKEFGNYKSFR